MKTYNTIKTTTPGTALETIPGLEVPALPEKIAKIDQAGSNEFQMKLGSSFLKFREALILALRDPMSLGLGGGEATTGATSVIPISWIVESSALKVMTNLERNKLAGIQNGAQVNTVTSVQGRVGGVVVSAADLGLGNVDNTSDVNKPVSTAQATAINARIPKLGYVGVSMNGASLTADIGKMYGVYATGVTITLPSATTVGDGEVIGFMIGVNAGRTLQINTTSSQNLITPEGVKTTGYAVTGFARTIYAVCYFHTWMLCGMEDSAIAAATSNMMKRWSYHYTVASTITGVPWRLQGFGASSTMTIPLASSVEDGTQIGALIVTGGGTVTLQRSGTDQFVTPTGLESSYVLRGNGNSIVLVKVTNTAWACLSSPDAQINAAIAPLAPLASPALTGTPTAPTAAVGTNTTQIATTAFCAAALAGKANDADVVKLTGDQSVGGTKTFTTSPVLPTPTAGDNTTKGANTAFVTGAIAACRPKHAYFPITTASTAIAAERGETYGVNASGCTITLPSTSTSGYVDGDEICLVLGFTHLRTISISSSSYILRGTGLQPVNTPFNLTGFGTFISFVKSLNVWVMSYPEYELSLKAPLASPALTGTPTAPTAAVGTNTTQLANCAFVQTATANAIYDLPVARSGLVTSGTDKIILETANAINAAWYDTTHVLNVSFFAQNELGLSENTTFKVQLYNAGTSTAHTIASITVNTLNCRLLQASIYRASSSSVNCSIQYGIDSSYGTVSLASGAYKLRVVCTSMFATIFRAAQVRFTK